jgi:hypothetical protein
MTINDFHVLAKEIITVILVIGSVVWMIEIIILSKEMSRNEDYKIKVMDFFS